MSSEGVAKDVSPALRDKSNIVCRTCNVKGHIAKYCYHNAPGGTLYIRDLPSSSTEETVQELFKPFGSPLHVKVGTSIDGSKWAFVNLEKRETGEAAIKELHDMSMKGREIVVQWSGEGMWSCRDPTCNKKNHDYMDACVQCKLSKKPKNSASDKLAMNKNNAESFMNACRTGDVSSALSEVIGVGVNYQEVTGATGLMWAVFKGHNRLALSLLTHPDIDVNIKSHKLGTALHWAVAARNTAIIHKLLAKQEIHLCIKNGDGRSALDLASFMNSSHIVNIIKVKSGCPGCSMNRNLCTTPVTAGASISSKPLLDNKRPSPSMENSREESSSSASIKNAFDCPVCLEQMEPPKRIWQCVQGHAICEGCRHNASMVSCPTCRGPFSGRNIAMEQVAQAVFQ